MAETTMVRCRRTDTGQELDYREAVARVLAAKVPPRVEAPKGMAAETAADVALARILAAKVELPAGVATETAADVAPNRARGKGADPAPAARDRPGGNRATKTAADVARRAKQPASKQAADPDLEGTGVSGAAPGREEKSAAE